MPFGRWFVKLSFGHPLAVPPQRYYYRRPAKPRGRHARLELAITVIVVVVVIAALLIFLFVFHDIPFRLGEPT
jgi:hypothetical protein